MSSLSFGQAASTLAIGQVGLSLGMFEQNVVNAAVLAIVITAFITSVRGAVLRVTGAPRHRRSPTIGQQILLDTRTSTSDISSLVQFAGDIARPDGGLVVPYGVIGDVSHDDVRAGVDRVTAEAAACGLDGDGLLRVGDSFTSATGNLVAELDASMALLTWDWAQVGRRLHVRQRHRRGRPGFHVPTIAAAPDPSVDTDHRATRQPHDRVAARRRGVDSRGRSTAPAGGDLDVVVLCEDGTTATLLEHDGDRDGMVVVTDEAAQDEVISRARPTRHRDRARPLRLRDAAMASAPTGAPAAGRQHRRGRRAAPPDDLAGVTTRPLSR